MSESLSYQLSQKLDARGYNGQLALGYLDAINDLMSIEERLFKPQLNENQQIVLAWLKHDYKEFDNQSPIEVPTSLFESFECGYLSDEEQLAFESLTEKQEAETIRAFMDWFLEQEEE